MSSTTSSHDDTGSNPLRGQRFGFLGCGRMGAALACALVERLGVPGDAITLCDRAVEAATALAQRLDGASVVEGAQALVDACDVLVLAIKPQDAPYALAGVTWPSGVDRVVVSVLAGVETSTLRGWVGEGVRVVRAMPNTPALVGAGVTAVLKTGISEVDALAEALFLGGGEVVMLDKEAWFDAVTAVSGSGPAYLFVAMEALADGGVAMGLPRAVASKLAMHTVHGAGALASSTGRHFAQLKDDVASPGGTTIHGLAALERAGFRAALIGAVRAAAERGAALGAQARQHAEGSTKAP